MQQKDLWESRYARSCSTTSTCSSSSGDLNTSSTISSESAIAKGRRFNSLPIIERNTRWININNSDLYEQQYNPNPNTVTIKLLMPSVIGSLDELNRLWAPSQNLLFRAQAERMYGAHFAGAAILESFDSSSSTTENVSLKWLALNNEEDYCFIDYSTRNTSSINRVWYSVPYTSSLLESTRARGSRRGELHVTMKASETAKNLSVEFIVKLSREHSSAHTLRNDTIAFAQAFRNVSEQLLEQRVRNLLLQQQLFKTSKSSVCHGCLKTFTILRKRHFCEVCNAACCRACVTQVPVTMPDDEGYKAPKNISACTKCCSVQQRKASKSTASVDEFLRKNESILQTPEERRSSVLQSLKLTSRSFRKELREPLTKLLLPFDTTDVIAAINIVGKDDVYCLALSGGGIVDVESVLSAKISRETSPCVHTLSSEKDYVACKSVAKDKRFMSNPFLVSVNAQSYVSIPIIAENDSVRIGSVDVVFCNTKSLDKISLSKLRHVAAKAMNIMSMPPSRSRPETVPSAASNQSYHRMVSDLLSKAQETSEKVQGLAA